MDLYIQNTSHNAIDFAYRLPGGGARQVPIGLGEQIRLAALTKGQVNAIVAHHRRYGLREAGEIAAPRGMIGRMVYSVDTPVPRLS